MKFNSYALTDRGLERHENQDDFISNEEMKYYIVADGMGGMKNGKQAANYTIQAVSESIKDMITTEEKEPGEILRKALTKAGAGFAKHLGNNSGSTVVAAMFSANEAAVANLGDSPAYLLRNGKMMALTKEHNLANLLVEAGRLKLGEEKTHHTRHQLIAFIGMNGYLPIHISEFNPRVKDRLLLCTDGLTGMVSEEMIKKVLESEHNPVQAARILVRLANEAGGSDNITVIIVDVQEDLKEGVS